MPILGNAVIVNREFTGNKFVNLPTKYLRQQQLKRRWPYIVSIEGGLAAGKSDFLTKCEDSYLNVMLCPEPQNLWRNVRNADANSSHTDANGSHEHPYSDEYTGEDDRYNLLYLRWANPERYSFSFNLWSLITRIETLNEVVQTATLDDEIDFIFVERSFEANRLFAEVFYEQKHFSEIERAMYEAWMRFLSERAQVSDGFIFLENQAETVLERLRKRGRIEEENVSEYFIDRIAMKHESWKDQLHEQNREFLEVSGDFDLLDDPYSWENLSSQLETFVFQLTGRPLIRNTGTDPVETLCAVSKIMF